MSDREKCDVIFEMCDVDKNGSLDIEEFWTYISCTRRMGESEARQRITKERYTEQILPSLGGGTSMDKDQLYQSYIMHQGFSIDEDYSAAMGLPPPGPAYLTEKANNAWEQYYAMQRQFYDAARWESYVTQRQMYDELNRMHASIADKFNRFGQTATKADKSTELVVMALNTELAEEREARRLLEHKLAALEEIVKKMNDRDPVQEKKDEEDPFGYFEAP